MNTPAESVQSAITPMTITVNSNQSTSVSKLTTISGASTTRENKNSHNQTRDLSYVRHQLIRPLLTKPKTTPTSLVSTRKGVTATRSVQRKPAFNAENEINEMDGEILRKFTSERCFVTK